MTFTPIIICSLATVIKGSIKGLEHLKKEDEWRSSKQLHYWDWPEYCEESWRLEETCCYSEFSERSSANADRKKSQGIIIIIIIIIINLKRETESLLIASRDNAIRINHIKVRIDKTQQNSKCRLCSDRDETINHIISECSKLAQKEYKARHDWFGRVIHREMCRKFQIDHTNKWYMHNQAPVLENDSHKPLWDFSIQTDHPIPARRPDLKIINNKKKENLQNCRLCCPGRPQNKSEGKWKEG